MKPKQNRIYLLLLGVFLALALIAMSFKTASLGSIEEGQANIVSKYKSTVPLVTAPLQILAKGLSIVNK